MRTAFVLFLFVFHFNGIAHPLHLSVVNMDFNQIPDSNVVSFRFFANDFLLALQNKYNEPIELNDSDSVFQRFCIQYVTDLFKISSLRGENYKLSFSSLTFANDMLWLSFTFLEEYHPEGWMVQNRLLFDLYRSEERRVGKECSYGWSPDT